MRLTLLVSSSLSSPPISTPSVSIPAPSATPSLPSNTNVTLPDGWSSIGCRQDDVSGRTLNVDAFTSENMTIAGCIVHCAALGHPIAGVEYARECYCGSAFVNGGGMVLPDNVCDMACSGDAARMCGGPGALSAFQTTSGPESVQARRAYRSRGSYGA